MRWTGEGEPIPLASVLRPAPEVVAASHGLALVNQRAPVPSKASPMTARAQKMPAQPSEDERALATLILWAKLPAPEWQS